MTQIHPIILPHFQPRQIGCMSSSLRGRSTSPYLLLKPAQLLRQVIIPSNVMTRLRLLEAETTEPKDKRGIRLKKKREK